MSDKVITIAIFASTIHAQYAKNSLEEAGIRVFLTGENTVSSSALQPLPVGNIRVQVFEADQEKASQIITQVQEELKETMETPMELEDETWERESIEPEADVPIATKESFAKRNRGFLISLAVVLLLLIWELKSGIFSGGPGDKEVTFTIELSDNSAGLCDINTTSLILIDRLFTYGFIERNIDIKADGKNLLIHLTDVDDVPRISRLLTRQGKLGFWETYENHEIYEGLRQADIKLASMAIPDSALLKQYRDLLATQTQKSNKPLDSDSTEKLTLYDQLTTSDKKNDVEQKLDSLRRIISKHDNPLLSILQPAIYQDVNGKYNLVEGPVVGYGAILDTGEINNILKTPVILTTLPRNVKFLWEGAPYDEEGRFLRLIAIKVTSRDGSPPIGNYAIEDAWQDYGQYSNRPEISMDMNEEGAETWRRLTGENIGNSIAIVLDDRVVSFPNIISEIQGGRSSISGDFTTKDASDFANVIASPPLPCVVNLVDAKVVEAQ